MKLKLIEIRLMDQFGRSRRRRTRTLKRRNFIRKKLCPLNERERERKKEERLWIDTETN